MRFLVDAQLPPALARWLVSEGHDASHVLDHGLESAPDEQIWAYAKKADAALITKDEDFSILAARETGGPKVVWIRRGNVSRRELLLWLGPLLPDVCKALEQGEILVEIF